MSKVKSLSSSIFYLSLMLAAPVCPMSYAEIAFAKSLEWLTVSSQQISIAEVITFVEKPSADTSEVRTIVNTQLLQVLKGSPPTLAEFIQIRRTRKDYAASPVTKGTQFLLFYDDKAEVSYFVNLDHPTLNINEVAISMNLEILTERSRILQAVNERLEMLSIDSQNVEINDPFNHLKPMPLLIEVLDGPVHDFLYHGSACYLYIPPDQTLKEQLMGCASGHTTVNDTRPEGTRTMQRHTVCPSRVHAVSMLERYPGEETVELLKNLLADNESAIESTSRKGVPIKLRVFGVRKAAYAALINLGVTVDEPVIYEEIITNNE